MREIGGFFELELQQRKEYHFDALRLNTGRNALEYILIANDYSKIYIPYYICESILEPINKLGIEFEYYNIDENFNIIMEFEKVDKTELILYVNYFGIFNNNVKRLIEIKKKLGFNLCIDNSQAFYNKPCGENHTIYSVRKFFGVPDGAYLYTKNRLNQPLEYEIVFDKCEYLLKRIELGATQSYNDFKESSNIHSKQPVKKMSKLTQRILEGIDYEAVCQTRLKNFRYLHERLLNFNELKIHIDDIICPMVYPLLIIGKEDIRKKLISQGIFVAQYWPGILDKVQSSSMENGLIRYLLPLPIDQRYGVEEMKYIVEIIEQSLS